MTTIADLHARRADVRETAKAFLDDHRNNDGILSAEDNATHKQAFWNAMRPNASPLEVRNALSEGVDAEGGYLVPDEFEHTLVQSSDPSPASSKPPPGDRKIPVVATHGTATWPDEGSAYTELR